MTLAPSPFTGTNSQLTIAGQHFNSPTAVASYVRELLWDQPLNVPFNGTVDAFLREWIQYHPRATEKVGPGVDCFLIQEHTDYGRPSRAIQIRRTDGTLADCSYKEPSRGLVQLRQTGAVQANPSDAIHDFKVALRRVVDPQVYAVKQRVFSRPDPVICPVTREQLDFSDADVDHVYPMTFDAIAWHWALIWDINPYDIELVDKGTYWLLADDDLAATFAGFHCETANLRVIKRAANNAATRYPTDWSLFR